MVPVAVVLLLLAGCARGPDGRQIVMPNLQELPKSQPSQAAAAVNREHARILASYGGEYEDPQLRALISRVVARLVAASDRPDQRYRITLLNSPAVNAFALPSGQLYVTRGLAALASDTSELASVLAHEMAHVVARHAAIREDKARQATLVSNVVNQVLSDPQMGALALAKSNIALASFSRSQEFEADGIGIGIAARAGFDPYGAERFLTSMGRNAALRAPPSQGDAQPIEFLSSHPSTPDRVRNAVTQARRYSAPGAGARDRPAYLAKLDGLVYGEDPNEGYVRGRNFLHPKLGFTFMAPEGFALDNTAQAVLGIKVGGEQALRLDVVRVPAEQSLAAYLTSGWLENVDASSIQDTTISGFPAATATARGEHWTFRLYAVRFGSDVYRFIFAAKQMTPEAARAFRQSIQSFRRLSLAEIRAAKPLRISIRTVQVGDTAEGLAREMALSDHPAERFRVLNGLGPKDQPKPGDLVKVVVE
ncbi:MAG: M48 family metalloprotease [Rhizobiales bacterium]|nr:M48 family metalloprotease [Hyphomicrobiales bacterium]